MLCAKPFKRGIEEFGCGQCLRCRINRRRTWTLRLMLEASQHQANSFITLTYRDEALPGHPANPSLCKRDLQLFFKRLRNDGLRFRYYAVGEYGDTTWRPHYHVLLFGVGRPLGHVDWSKKEACPCVICANWSMGHVHIGSDCSREAVQYCAGYVMKKLTNKADERLGGRAPEFCVMSRNKGIGFGAVKALFDTIGRPDVARTFERYGDMPNRLRVDGKMWPIGRYLRGKVGDLLGMDRKVLPGDAPPVHVLELWQELLSDGGRVAREDRRLQHARNAAVRSSIMKSRRVL